MSSDTSTNESAPPNTNACRVSAEMLNPVWAASKRSHASKRRRPSLGDSDTKERDTPAEDEDGSLTLGPISMTELEHAHRTTADGAESSLFSDDSDDDDDRNRTKKQRCNKRALDDSDTDGSDDDTARSKKVTNKKGDTHACIENAAVASAAFGSNAPDMTSVYDESDVESSCATGSALVPYRRTFPVRGVICVGCSAERDIVSKVDDYIKKNASKMQQDALYRTASVFWHTVVVKPARAEGVEICGWDWKSLRSHYQLHVCDAFVQRMDCCRQLASVRKMLELQLVQNVSGRRVIHHKNTDLLLKVIGMQSKELTLLDTASMPPPASRPRSQAVHSNVPASNR